MTLRRLRGLFPLCINPTTLSSSFPVPLLDFFPSTAVPTGTNSGQRPSLLAAPENPDYRPVFFKDECQTLAKYPKGWWNSIEFIDDRIINWSQLTILQLLNHCSCGNMSEWFESAGVSISEEDWVAILTAVSRGRCITLSGSADIARGFPLNEAISAREW